MMAVGKIVESGVAGQEARWASEVIPNSPLNGLPPMYLLVYTQHTHSPLSMESSVCS